MTDTTNDVEDDLSSALLHSTETWSSGGERGTGQIVATTVAPASVEVFLDAVAEKLASPWRAHYAFVPGGEVLSVRGDRGDDPMSAEFLLGSVAVGNASVIHPLDLPYMVTLTRAALSVVGNTEVGIFRSRYHDGWRAVRMGFTSGLVDGQVLMVLSVADVELPDASPLIGDDVVDVFADAVVLFDPDGKVKYRSAGYERLMGRDMTSMTNEPMLDMIDPDDEKTINGVSMEELVALEHPVVRVERQDGSEMFCELNFSNHLDTPGVWAMSCSVRDVTERVREERRRMTSEALLQVALTNSSDALALVNADMTMRYRSPAYDRMFGIEEGTPVGAINGSIIHPDEHERVHQVLSAMIQSGTEKQAVRFRAASNPNGIEWLEGHYTNMLEDPDVGAIVCNIRDISDRVAEEQRLRKAEAMLQAVWTYSPDAVMVLDENGYPTWRSPSFDVMLGLDPQLDSHEIDWGMIPQSDRVLLNQAYLEVLHDPERAPRVQFIVRVATDDGDETRHIECIFTNRMADPAVGGIIVYCREVTDFVQAQQRLVRDRAFFETMLSNSDTITSVVAFNGDILYTNTVPNMLDMDNLHSTAPPAAGNFFEFVQPDDVDDVRRRHEASFENPDRAYETKVRVLIDGEVRVLHCRSRVLPEETGLNAAVVNCVDVTAEEAVTEQLARNERRWRAIVSQSRDALFVITPDLHVESYSPSANELLGRNVHTGDSVDWSHVVHRGDHEKFGPVFEYVIANPGQSAQLQFRIVRPDGSARHVRMVALNLTDNPDIGGLLVSMRDVTDEVVAYEALESSERKWRSILSQSSDAIIVYNENGEVLFRSEAFGRIFGVKVEETSRTANYGLVHPEDRSVVESFFARLSEVESISRITYRVLRKGKVRWVEAVASRGPTFLPDCYITNVRDVTDEVAAREQISELNNQLEGWVGDLKDARDQLRLMVNQLEDAREQERRRIAWVLHDESLQSLLAAKMLTDLGLEDPSNPDGMNRPTLESARDAIDASVDAMRRVVAELRPEVRGLGLQHLLEEQIPSMAGEDLSWHLHVGDMRGVDDDVTQVLFRSIQEALRNVRRHSGASSVEVKVEHVGDEVVARVVDDGVGVDTAALEIKRSAGHFGVASIRESAQVRGGRFRIERGEHGGTIVELVLPAVH